MEKKEIITNALLEASQNLLNKIEKNIEQIYVLESQLNRNPSKREIKLRR